VTTATPSIGAPIDRIDGPEKVTGTARYAFEHGADNVVYATGVQSTIAKGRIASIETGAAREMPGVIAVLTYQNAPRLHEVEGERIVLQSDRIAYHGEFVALVVADTLEIARHAAALVQVDYAPDPHVVVLPQPGDPLFYKPDAINPAQDTDTFDGDFDAAFAAAPVSIDRTYTTPTMHNNPLEPHATVASWVDGTVTLYDAFQGPFMRQGDIAAAFGIPEKDVHVIGRYVGGAFGSKSRTHPHQMLAVMAAQVTGRVVKLGLTRHQMFAVVGYRTPTIQRYRLGAERDGTITAVAHDVAEQTGTVEEFAEQTGVITRMMYAGANRQTTHRLAALDVPTPTIMRAPGECPGSFAIESAMDELAIELGMDPVELRIRNEPDVDPECGLPYSSRSLIACLREGAERFGWAGRDPAPRARREGDWLVGTGVAASTYPARQSTASASARANADGTYAVAIGAVDLGTGSWTVLTQIAADALGVPIEAVSVDIGDSDLPRAPAAGGSQGTSSWGAAVVAACEDLRSAIEQDHGGDVPPEGVEVTASTEANPDREKYSMHAFGAQFAEVRVDAVTGEVRVPRMVGVFGIGRAMNPKTARSQLLGGMNMGVSMALFEASIMDARFGHYATHDLAEYHVATHADAPPDIDISWVDEHDPHVNPMGAKGIGEVGIVGTAAAIANAVHHATGVRVRDLPVQLDDLLT
jgi:xanthine dehydrogenase YagR molybdenum-binding subunit